jgi:hypothetical protein
MWYSLFDTYGNKCFLSGTPVLSTNKTNGRCITEIVLKQRGSCYSIFSFMCMLCRSLFVLLYFFFWRLCCLFFFHIRILITPLVSSNSSCLSFCFFQHLSNTYSNL